MAKTTYTAVVEKTISDGKHGSYAVASSEDLGTITFSLDPSVWQEEDWPEGGNVVVLSKVRKKRAGWRAHSGRFFQPSDEQQPATKQQHQKGAVR
jgi:hypothetical protein